jgi:hypothetical protein
MALGMLVPVAFAATTTTSWTHKVAGQLPIVVNGTATSNPFELTAVDSGNTTAYFPMFYFNQALNSLGYTATWDGVNHVWNISAPNADASQIASSIAGGVGTGNTSISVNGTVVKKINTYAAQDPAASKTAAPTSYFPAFYINEIFNGLGATVSFSGQTGLSITKASTTNNSGATLSAITVTGSNSGDGSVTNPAVALSDGSLTLSTTLQDANGNALANTAVTFNVSEYNQFPGQLPSVQNAAGTLIAGTAQSNYEQYTAYTDSTGVASVKVSGPAGQTFGYEIQAVAPYASGTSAAVSSQPVYAEFVSGQNVGFTPGGNGTFNATVGAQVPVTITLPLNPTTQQPYANAAIQLHVSGNGQFTNASGSTLGNTIDVATNSSGVAQALLTDGTGETVSVSATLPSGLGLANPSNLSIAFGQSGVPSQILNYSVSASNDTAQVGQNIVVSGQLADAQGNPVANGQILVTAPNTASGNALSYVSGTTTTAFPIVAQNSIVSGTPANSSVGDVVTADANGNFSITLTDTRPDGTNTAAGSNGSAENYYIWPVSNGSVTNNAVLNGTNNSVSFTPSTTVSKLSIGGIESVVQGNSNTSITGLTAQANAGGANPGIGTDTGINPQVTDVYVEPQNASGHHDITSLNTTQLTYQLSASNGGLIYSINGTQLSSPVGSVTLTYNGNGTFTANGQNIGSLSAATLAGKSVSANADDFEVGVTNANEGATTLTITSGTASSTAGITFNGQTPDQVASFTPASGTVTAGSTLNAEFNVQDINGNAVGQGTAVNIYTDNSSADPFWVTQVNGVGLSASVNTSNTGQPSYATDNTPIPLGEATGVSYDVSQSGVALWTHGSNYFTAYTDASGNVSLTLQSGGLSFPTPGSATLTNVASESGSVYVYTNTNGANEPVLFSTSSTIPGGMNQEIGFLNSTGGVVAGAVAHLTGLTYGAETGSAALGGGFTVATPATGMDANGNSVSATGGTYTISGTPATSLVGIDSSTGAVTIGIGATTGSYTVTYTLNGVTTTATIIVA